MASPGRREDHVLSGAELEHGDRRHVSQISYQPLGVEMSPSFAT